MMAAVSIAIGLAGFFMQALMRPKQKDNVGPRLADVNVPSVSPGNPIAKLWGTMKLGGQTLFVSRLIETKHVESTGGGKGGGKGGGGGKNGPNTIYYTYSVDAAIGVCAGPIWQYNRIWANQKLLWVNPAIAAQAARDFREAYEAEVTRLVDDEQVIDYTTAYASGFFFAFNNYRTDEVDYGVNSEAVAYVMAHPGSTFTPTRPDIPPADSAYLADLITRMLDPLGKDKQYAKNKIRFDAIDIYCGDETQQPNSKIESWIGVGNVPAYRGVSYFVMHGLQLEDFGNALPTFNIEVQERAGSSKTTLYGVITDLCLSSGMARDEFDAASFIDTDVEMQGYALTQPTSARDAILALQKVFPFDAAETRWKIVFSWINQRPLMVLRRADLGAHADDDQMPASMETMRLHDLDLPRRINLKFQEKARNFSTNTVHVTRAETKSTSVDDREVTIALPRGDAKKWMEEQLALAYAARRTFKVFLPRKYVLIEPGDVVMIPEKDYPDTYMTLRAIETNVGNNGIVEVTFIDLYHHVEPNASTDDDLTGSYDEVPKNLPQGSATSAYLFDCPLLVDQESDNVGFYVVLCGTNLTWQGGVLLIDMGSGQATTAFNQTTQSAAAGANWVAISKSTEQSPHGWCMTTLATGCRPMMWDRKSVVRVYMRNRMTGLVNAAEGDLLTQPLNMAFMGDELVQFANARDLGNGVWELSTFLRGLRGTEQAMNSHHNGERFVRMRTLSTHRVTHDQRYLNAVETYRPISFGDSSDSASSFTFTNTGNSLRPRAPMFKAETRRFGDGTCHLEWLPRARQNGNWMSGRDVMLDQPSELYEVDVVISGVVIKTHGLGSARTWDYTAAMQTADLGAPASAIMFRLFQIGQIIGRGYGSEISL